MKSVGKIILLLITICVASCQKSGNDPLTNYNLNPAKLLRLINEVRVAGCKCGDANKPPVPKLQWNDQLAKAAYLHSVDMNTNRFFDHTSLDGRKTGDRVKAVGYNASTHGENIARNYNNEDAVIRAWLASPGHCSNIMSKDFTEVGAGHEGIYWTMVFARPASSSGK